MTLKKFLEEHAVTGKCGCHMCQNDTTGNINPAHTVNLVFFYVSSINNPDKSTFVELINIASKQHSNSSPAAIFNGRAHKFTSVGTALGLSDNETLRLFGLGAILGLWKVVRPNELEIGFTVSEASEKALASNGLIYVIAENVMTKQPVVTEVKKDNSDAILPTVTPDVPVDVSENKIKEDKRKKDIIAKINKEGKINHFHELYGSVALEEYLDKTKEIAGAWEDLLFDLRIS